MYFTSTKGTRFFLRTCRFWQPHFFRSIGARREQTYAFFTLSKSQTIDRSRGCFRCISQFRVSFMNTECRAPEQRTSPGWRENRSGNAWYQRFHAFMCRTVRHLVPLHAILDFTSITFILRSSRHDSWEIDALIVLESTNSKQARRRAYLQRQKLIRILW